MWTQLDADAGVTGPLPSARYDHSMTTVGQDIYIFGWEAGKVGEGEDQT